MNLPTNKLRDLIAVLQTLDPDTITDIHSIFAIDDGGQRVLKLCEDTSRSEEIILQNISDKLTTDLFEPKDNTLGDWAVEINRMGSEIERLDTSLADLREKYDELSYRLDNVKEILASANNLLT